MNAKILALLMLATVSLGAGLAIDYAEAKEVTMASYSTSPPSESNSQLSKKTSELNRKLEELEYRLSNEQTIADLNKHVSELRDSVRDGRKESLDSASTSLSNLISLNSWIITIVGLVFAILAVFGFKSIKDLKLELKQEISNELTLKYQQNLIQETAKLQADYTRELNDLASRVDELKLSIRQLANNEYPTKFNRTKDQAESKENAFD